ncbi:LysR family transcriptional regulator [Parashewanella curva]|uniref:LysR family transcriptional regulator n=1 Tax=Parashewanella curva TaxID=2338552 RepID=A0A3L8PYI4_9GAMM|nr:LysR family transcriptional regulator [Parashewanella curva]RLV59528.1 LysR family transcriptional regulator [Parashewanella curva]
MNQTFDLNLLKVLDVLLEEKSVTQTAKRLHVTQSAVSKHLARLREMFSDPLLIRSGKSLKATPKALSLAVQIKSILHDINQLTEIEHFEPSTCSRRFRFDMIEVSYAAILPEFMPPLLSSAPEIKLDIQTWNAQTMKRLLNCETDFAVRCLECDPRSRNHISSLPDELEYAELCRDHAICIVRNHHPILQSKRSMEDFFSLKHIQVTGGGNRHWLYDEVLTQKGINRETVIEMPDFHGALRLCERSDLLLYAPYHQVKDMIKGYDVTVIDIPIEMEPGIFVLIWNRYFNNDPAHQWVRKHIVETVSL